MAHVKRSRPATQEPAATNSRNFRTFLLVAQLEAKAIGERIAKARLEAGLTQEALAEMATFSKRSLQDYETGVTIPYRHMREISGLLDRPVEWFLHGEKEEGPLGEVFLGRLEALVERAEGAAERLERAQDG